MSLVTTSMFAPFPLKLGDANACEHVLSIKGFKIN